MSKLLPHQIPIHSEMMEQKKGIIHVPMGGGKSFLVIYTTQALKSSISLVVLPKSLIMVWQKEVFEEFFPDMKVLYFHNDYCKTHKYVPAMLMGYECVVTTYEMCVAGHGSSIFGAGALFGVEWDDIICDESQKFSNPRTKIFGAVTNLNGNRKWCLSGTPVRNGKQSELWAQLKFCGVVDCTENEWASMDQSKKSNYTKVGLIDGTKNQKKETPRKQMKVFDRETSVVNVVLSDNERRFYDNILPTLRRIMNFVKKGSLSHTNALAALTKARLSCISPWLVNDDVGYDTPEMFDKVLNSYKDWLEEKADSSKMLALKGLMSEISGKSIIFSSFSTALSMVEELLKDKTVYLVCGSINSTQRKKLIDEFINTKDNSAVLLMTYKVGAEGWNLSVVKNVVHLDPFWNNSVHSQAVSRACRPGQKSTVREYFLIVEDSIEVKIRDVAKKKDSQNKGILTGAAYSDVASKDIDMILS